MMAEKKENIVIVVSAPSGAGKTTIVDALLKRMGGITQTISYTTRSPREGEVHGKDYVFVSQEEFQARIQSGDFLEWEENFDNYYGTSQEQLKGFLSQGLDVILSIDVKGARTVRSKLPGAVSVFIMPPSEDVLFKRLRDRKTDDPAQLVLRIQEAKKEIEASEEYDYMIINDKVNQAIKDLGDIIISEREPRTIAAKEGETSGS